MRRVVVVTPRRAVRGGNRVTALRWARHLRALGWSVRVWDAEPLYARIRETIGSAINLEGAARIGDELWLFHRGNTGANDPGPAVARFDLRAMRTYLEGGPLPAVLATDGYDLGEIEGVRLGFTDAIADGSRVLYLAAAEQTANAYRLLQEREKLAEILLPNQLKRLNQIYLQVAGVNALNDSEVAKELEITDEQREKMTTVRQENAQAMGEQMRELFQSGGEREQIGVEPLAD